MSGESPAARLRALCASAVIGTDRCGDALRASAVLDEAAVVGARARAGWVARRVGGVVPECPEDRVPAAGGALMALLMRVLGDRDAGMVEEWSRLALAKGIRVGDAQGAEVLDWWARQPRRSEVVFRALGERGRWLASLDPAWGRKVAAIEVPDDAEEAWQTGRSRDRLALLQLVRSHDPSRALAMVRSTWDRERAEDRKKFVQALFVGLSAEDEAFLEGVLDDASAEVRIAAARRLAFIPGSRLRVRMTERARRLIRVERGGGRRGGGRVRIVVSPPESIDAALERDATDALPAHGDGEREWWVERILSAADLSVWTEVSGLDPAGVLGAIDDEEHGMALTWAMRDAMRADGDLAWRTAILRKFLERGEDQVLMPSAAWTGLAPAEAEALMFEAASHEGTGRVWSWRCLDGGPAEWSREFSLKVLGVLSRGDSVVLESWKVSEAVDRISRCVSPLAALEFEKAVRSIFADEPLEGFKKCIDRVYLRAEMRKEFEA
ncbi:MAG: DUF5691 domain-containing protein [Phycisphaerales bacterium]